MTISRRLGYRASAHLAAVVAVLALGPGSLPGAVIAGNPVSGVSLLGAFDSRVDAIDPSTGERTSFASLGIDSLVNGQFVVDSANGRAYALHRTNGSFGIRTLDLESGRSADLVAVSQFELPTFGLYRGQLLGMRDGSIDVIDTTTGRRSHFAFTGLESSVNGQFAIDERLGRAYILGRNSGAFVVSTVDLQTGAFDIASLATGFPPDLPTFAMYNETLLSSGGSSIFTFDPSTGQKTFLAATGLDTGVNHEFVVDGASHTAYVLGRSSGAFVISATNLRDGTYDHLPVSGLPSLALYIPEPSLSVHLGLAVLAVLGGRWR